MTKERIKQRIAEIKRLATGDYEEAHVREDELYLEFIGFVAENPGVDFSEMAKLVLSVSRIEFARWCA